MLGKLSRFLRFFGYDTLYRKEESVEEMFETSINEARIILTQAKDVRNRCLKLNIESFLIPTFDIGKQVLLIKNELALELTIPPKKTRCSTCNGELEQKKKEDIIELIPEGTAKFCDDFWSCLDCGKIYWIGSHWKDIERILKEANMD